MVSGRPDPPVPDDVPDGHPLRDPAIIRRLAVSGHPGDVGKLANREVRRLLNDSMTERDVLGFLTAAPRGLTSRELADLTGAPLWEVEDVLRTVSGRTFASRPGSSGVGQRPEVYLLAHGELKAQAKTYLGSQLQGYEERLRAMVDGHRTWAPNYAELLRQLRAEQGLTQEELAAAAGLSPRTVADLERGINQTPRRATAELLADALRLPETRREQFMAAARRRPIATDRGVITTTVGSPEADTGAAPDGAVDKDASNLGWIEPAASTAFVGREEELGILREAWSSARAGRRVLTLVAGEPGIGKTALTAELARSVRADGGLVLYGRSDEHVPAPYQAFREALNDYARACPDALLRRDLAGLAEEIARLFPEPASRVGASAAPQAAAQAERFRLFESLDTWIGRIAARHPVLLVLDDLQWADQPSLYLLQHLMRARRSTPLLTVAMYRNLGAERSEFSTALPSLTRDIDCRRVSLRGLEHRGVTALLEDAAGRTFGERESGMVAELEWETAGNPFFLPSSCWRWPGTCPRSARSTGTWSGSAEPRPRSRSRSATWSGRGCAD
jgi:transcriptional regulator with XRE-family HTH domain